MPPVVEPRNLFPRNKTKRKPSGKLVVSLTLVNTIRILKLVRCGKLDHHISQYLFFDPRYGQAGGATPNNPKENKPNPRVYALTQEQADNSNDVVEGNILINKMYTCMLFYCGATHSYIAKRFAKKLRAKPDNL